MKRIDYDEFDLELLDNISEGINSFSKLLVNSKASWPERSSFKRRSRVLDRRLQKLRKEGLIEYSSKTGWTRHEED